MIYQSVSISNVIAQVIRNTKIQDSTYIMDMDEWIPEAMELMHTRFVVNSFGPETIEVTFHKGKLPCGLVSISAIEYCGRRLQEKKLVIRPDMGRVMTPWYEPEMGFINTSFQDGNLNIYGDKLPVDTEGMPLIPDNGDYKEALYYFVRAKMSGCGYKDVVFNEQVLMDRFEKHAARAIGAISYPSVDSMEAKVATMVNFIPAQNYFDNYFKVDGDEAVYGGEGASSGLSTIITSTGTGVPVDLNPNDPELDWTIKQF